MGLGGLFAPVFSWLGTPAQIITAGSTATLLGLFIRWQLGLRRIAVQAAQVKIEASKVESADDAILMGHWKGEVQSLRDKLNGQEGRFQDALAAQEQRHNDALIALEERHSRALAASDKRQATCEQERERLAERVRQMSDEMAQQAERHRSDFAGLEEKIRMTSADHLRILAASDEPVPPYALEAAQRIVERHGPK
jgi:flagellar biosynthesis GTPase FlhF